MGISAGLFFTTDDTENSLAYRLRPSDEQRDAQQERWNDLKEVLLDELRKKSGYALSSWLQGSYKFGTQIRPARHGDEFDIDLGVYFLWTGEHDEGEHYPIKLKAFVQEVLEDYAADSANAAVSVSEPKARCNRIHFDDAFHIDVPAYHLDQPRDLRGLATNNNTWENSDPKAIYLWWKNSLGDLQRARARRLVRYMKMWAALKIDENDRPSSILLTVLACNSYLELDETNLSGDDEYFCELVSQILVRLRHSWAVANPANAAENLNRLSAAATQNLIAELDALVSIADRALAAPTKGDSADIWSEVFDHFFPMPEEEELVKDARGNAVAAFAFDPQVQIVARAGNREFRCTNSIGPIPKGSKLHFSLINLDQLPEGATVSWVVRNSGFEAESENDLGHRNQNGIVAEETTAYRGDHHMDITVKLNGRAIGRRRVLVRVSGLGMPIRNPVRRSYGPRK